ncbi:MAG: PPC domain-containing protein [Verrucomicrobiota bacterium]
MTFRPVPFRRDLNWLTNWFATLFLSSAILGAAPPTLEHFYPIAFPAGTTNTLTAIGKFEPWPPQIWCSSSGLQFQTETNQGKLTLTIPKDVPPGPHLVRLFNESGASEPRLLIVTDTAQSPEVEPNDQFTKPQSLDSLPLSLNGRLDKNGDVDSFAFEIESGQTLVADVEAYTLASPIDAVLRLVDEQGRQLAFNHDNGRTLDPQLVWTAPATGKYVLQVFGFAYPATSDVRFTGGNACVYRLHVSRGPHIHHTLPMGLQRASATRLRLVGWNLSALAKSEFVFDAKDFCNLRHESAPVRIPGANRELQLPIGDGPELLENDLPSNDRTLCLPSAVTGIIERVGEKDAFEFHATKGEFILLEVQSARFGFPLDPRLKLLDAQGKQIAENDDRFLADPQLEWKAPNDGRFTVVVENVLNRAGPDHCYRLSLRRAGPDVKFTVNESEFKVQPGKTAEIKVAVRRVRGYGAQVFVAALDLPKGVSCDPVEVASKNQEITLTLKASGDAQPYNGTFRVVGIEADSAVEFVAVKELIGTGENNGVPNGYHTLLIHSTDQLWLTVLKAEEAKSKE